MSVIKVTLPPGQLPVAGKQVSFKAPCDCSATEAIQIDGVNYTVCDALGRCVTGEGGVWAAGEIISVILCPEGQKAYIQNGNLFRTATGSYVGTGTSDAPSTVTLTFDFPPKVLMLFDGNGLIHLGSGSGFSTPPAIGFPQMLTTEYATGLFDVVVNGTDLQAKRSEDGKTISWQNKGGMEIDGVYYYSHAYAFNAAGVTYHYMILG